MTKYLLYLVGAPGVGKSTLARELTGEWDRTVHRNAPVPHSTFRNPSSGIPVGLELGVPREDFPGTDALAMDIGPRAGVFLREAQVVWALGEGSRLATRPFLGGAVRAGVHLTLVSLRAGEELLHARWVARGSRQNSSWRKGAATRARNITDWAHASGIRVLDLPVDGAPVRALADEVRAVFPHVHLGG
jgi:hypothetical protein